MDSHRKLGRLKRRLFVVILVFLWCQGSVCWSRPLNDEGLVSNRFGAVSRVVDLCSWFGVECSEREAVVLNSAQAEDIDQRRWLLEKPKVHGKSRPISPLPQAPAPAPIPPTSPSPSPDIHSPRSSLSVPIPSPSPSSDVSSPVPSPSETNSALNQGSSSRKHKVILLAGIIGGSTLSILIVGTLLWKCSKTSAVKPWATGLSGQLQKAFVTGVPKLKRSELDAACEDFSNVIGCSPIGTVYKGTLSSGVEIAVASVVVASAKEWSTNLETQFRKKIDMLSKVNHKNFVNLLGFCEEDDPFTRMMVFEYAPNGTLFEHLHIKESEHLDWGMRLRIAMGMAYCLDHMHNLNSPVPHNNLSSSSVSLTEDYAAKVSDFSFWNETAQKESTSKKLSQPPPATQECNVYSFGVLLFEMVTGRMPFSVDNSSTGNWASDYLQGMQMQPLVEIVDPTLNSFNEDQVEKIGEVIKSCVEPDPTRRPTMREVTARLREITAVSPDRATPKLSPLWWAELEILSADAS